MAAGKRARIQDVAEKAGVSSMTVSRVLNQDAKVSDATREVVMKAVKELNYKPNVSARRLASNKSFFIGLLYFDLDTSYVNKFLLRALKSCRAKGQHLVADEINEDRETSLKAVRDLIEVTQVDGVILLPPVCNDEEVLKILTDAKVPFIRIAPDAQLTLSPYICMDDYQAAFDMTEMLIKQGHSKIAHIIGNPNQGISRIRYQGYLDALRSNQITVPPEYIQQGMFTYDSGFEATKTLLELDDKPTAVFASNDEMAAAALSAAHMNHMSVPQHISIVGFDDGHLATTISPHLTTVRQPIQEMAELAIDLLSSGKFDDLDKPKSGEFRHVLDFDIIERESSSKLV